MIQLITLKKFIFLIGTVILLIAFLLLFYVLKNRQKTNYGLGVVPSSNKLQNQFCADKKTGEKLSYMDALNIAQKSDCVKQSEYKVSFTEKYFCNENTGTFWVDLNIIPAKNLCNPACVVNVVNKSAEINWRCTGATLSK